MKMKMVLSALICAGIAFTASAESKEQTPGARLDAKLKALEDARIAREKEREAKREEARQKREKAKADLEKAKSDIKNLPENTKKKTREGLENAADSAINKGLDRIFGK